MPELDWEKLSELEQSVSRRQITFEITKEKLENEIKNLNKSIAAIREVLLVSGLACTDIYHEMARKNCFSSDETWLLPRVRKDSRYGTPSFYWESTIMCFRPMNSKKRSKPVQRKRSYEAFVCSKDVKSKEKMRVILLSKHIAINKRTLTVPQNTFAKEPEWARIAASLIEPKLVYLRRISKETSSLSKKVCALSKIVSNRGS